MIGLPKANSGEANRRAKAEDSARARGSSTESQADSIGLFAVSLQPRASDACRGSTIPSAASGTCSGGRGDKQGPDARSKRREDAQLFAV